MDDERDPIYEDEEILEIVRRYENMKKNKTQYFFDVYEFENIINYYIESNNSNNAYEAASLASIQHPSSIPIQLKKAQVLVDKGETLQSMQILDRLEALDSSNYEVFAMKGTTLSLMGDIEGARKNFDQALALDPENREDLIVEIALSFQYQGHYPEALRYLRLAVDTYPENTSVLYELGFCYNKLNNLDKSIEYYKRYLDLEPYSDNVWYNLGIIYNKSGDFDKSIEAYDFALAINDQNAFAHFNKGNILANLEKYKDAIEAYLEYLKIDEESSEALTYIAECYESLNDTTNAIKYFRKALEVDPDFPEPWYGLGKLFLKENLAEDSLYYLKKAIELDKDDPDYWIALSMALLHVGDLQEAEEALKEALKLDPYDYHTWVDLGDILIKSGRVSDTLSLLEKANDNLPENAGIIFRTSACYFLLENEKKALEFLSKGLELNHHKYQDLFTWYPDGETNQNVMRYIHKFKKG
jgi:tetratricopeptide (TPR) repeat protein